jgi:hypothetical protein
MVKLKVVFGLQKSSFVDLPPAFVQQMLSRPQTGGVSFVVKIVHDSGTVFAAWGGGSCAVGQVGLSPKFASCLELQEGEELDVTVFGGVPPATRVHVEPVSEDDWEILVFILHFVVVVVGLAHPCR